MKARGISRSHSKPITATKREAVENFSFEYSSASSKKERRETESSENDGLQFPDASRITGRPDSGLTLSFDLDRL